MFVDLRPFKTAKLQPHTLIYLLILDFSLIEVSDPAHGGLLLWFGMHRPRLVLNYFGWMCGQSQSRRVAQLTSEHLLGNEKASGHCICRLGEDSSSSSHPLVAAWRTGIVKNNGRTRSWAAQSIASWLASSIILTGRRHNTPTCTPPTSSLLPMNLSLGPISPVLFPLLALSHSSLRCISFFWVMHKPKFHSVNLI